MRAGGGGGGMDGGVAIRSTVAVRAPARCSIDRMDDRYSTARPRHILIGQKAPGPAAANPSPGSTSRYHASG